MSPTEVICTFPYILLYNKNKSHGRKYEQIITEDVMEKSKPVFSFQSKYSNYYPDLISHTYI
jgi:hypothetical protein